MRCSFTQTAVTSAAGAAADEENIAGAGRDRVRSEDEGQRHRLGAAGNPPLGHRLGAAARISAGSGLLPHHAPGAACAHAFGLGGAGHSAVIVAFRAAMVGLTTRLARHRPRNRACFQVGQPSSRKASRSFGENEGSPERAHSAKGSETWKSLSVILGQYIQGLLAVLRTMSRMLPVC